MNCCREEQLLKNLSSSEDLKRVCYHSERRVQNDKLYFFEPLKDE